MASLPDKWTSNIHSIYPLYWGFICYCCCLISTNLPLPKGQEKVHLNYSIKFSKALCILNYCITNPDFLEQSIVVMSRFVPFTLLQIPICNIHQVKIPITNKKSTKKSLAGRIVAFGFHFRLFYNILNYCKIIKTKFLLLLGKIARIPWSVFDSFEGGCNPGQENCAAELSAPQNSSGRVAVVELQAGWLLNWKMGLDLFETIQKLDIWNIEVKLRWFRLVRNTCGNVYDHHIRCCVGGETTVVACQWGMISSDVGLCHKPCELP